MLKFFIFVIFFSLQAYSQSWDTMRLAYDYHFKGAGGTKKLFSPKGDEIISKVQQFVVDPKNAKYMNTKDGKTLLQNHKKYLNFLSAKQSLQKCQNNKSSSRNLENSILSGVLNESQSSPTCKNELIKMYSQINQLETDITQVSKDLMEKKFLENIENNTLLNTLEAYLKNKYKFDQNFKTKNDEQVVEESISKFCPKEACNQLKKIELKEFITRKITKYKDQDLYTTPKQLQQRVNKKIDNLNTKLSEINIKRSSGAFSDYVQNGVHFVVPYMIDSASPDLEDSETQNQFNNYLNEFIEVTSDDDGILMHSSSIREKMGNLRSIKSEDDINEDTHAFSSSYIFEEHEHITNDDAEEAIEELFYSVDKQLDTLESNKHKRDLLSKKIKNINTGKIRISLGTLNNQKKKLIKNQISHLVATNPRSVSQLLAKKPQYALVLCDALLSLDQKDIDQENNGQAILVGGAVLGVLGLFTGGLTWLVGGALSAGAAATLGAVTTSLVLSGTAASVVGGSITFKESYQMQKEAQAIEDGLLTENGFGTSHEKMRDSYLAYKDAFYNIAENAMLSLVGMGALGHLSKMKKSGVKFINANSSVAPIKITSTAINRMSEFYKRIASSPKTLKLLENTLKKLGPKGETKLNEFLAQVAYLPEKTRQKLLLGILALAPNSEKLVNFIKKAQCK